MSAKAKSSNEANNEGDDGSSDDHQSPGYQFSIQCLAMQQLYEKLTMLNYVQEFCTEYRCKPIHRYYFSYQMNHGEQFYTFSCLAAWLIKSKCKLQVPNTTLNPQDYEDPNVTISAIMDALRKIVDTVEFPPNKLKGGSGVEVIWTLNTLADKALEENKPKIEPIIIKGASNDVEEEDVKDSNDDDLEIKFEEDCTMMVEDEGYGGPAEELTDMDPVSYEGMSIEKPKAILESTTDFNDWKLEVERVLPQLRVFVRSSDQKADWRIHWQELKTNREQMDTHFNATQNALKKLTSDLDKNLDKISTREKYLQTQLESIINEYNSLRTNLREIAEHYRQVSGGVTQKSRQLAEISEELESIKQEMEERGTSMTDGTPLISLRKALGKMKTEINSIDIRIGVAMHTLLQARISESSAQIFKRKASDAMKPKKSLQSLVF